MADELQAALARRRGGAGAVPASPVACAPVACAPGTSPGASASASTADAFARFLGAADALEVQKAYDETLASLGLERATLAKLCECLAPVLPHRSRQLLSALELRAAQPQYTWAKNRPRGVRSVLSVVIVGAGPVGLRTAIELALVGAQCVVLEGRERFSRLQVLHLWEWVETDLIENGIKLLDPSIFSATDLRRCTTAQLQHSLLKVALVLGVRVRFNTRVETLPSLTESLKAQGLRRVDVLVDASGARCALLATLGFDQPVAFRSARALCIVISLMNRKTPEELQVRESTWSQQYYQTEFASLAAAGVSLQVRTGLLHAHRARTAATAAHARYQRSQQRQHHAELCVLPVHGCLL